MRPLFLPPLPPHPSHGHLLFCVPECWGPLFSYTYVGQIDLNSVNDHAGMWCETHREGFSGSCHPLVTQKWQQHFVVMASILVTNNRPGFFVGEIKQHFSLFPVLWFSFTCCWYPVGPAGFGNGFRYHLHLKIMWGKFWWDQGVGVTLEWESWVCLGKTTFLVSTVS